MASHSPSAPTNVDTLVIGGGIGGLSAARVLVGKKPDAHIVLLEKEPELGQGTSRADHNTGTGHTGAFYPPGSAKATAANEGFKWLRQYHDEKGMEPREVGKIIAASQPGDSALLQKYQKQALANGQKVASILSGDELREKYEPLLSRNITEGLWLPEAYLFDANGVIQAMAGDIRSLGGEIKTKHKFLGVRAIAEGWLVTTNQGEFLAKNVVNCAGTHSDRIARMAAGHLVDEDGKVEIEISRGARDWKIMPVMGSYVELNRVADWRTAVYEPTRNPPFLGVHVMPGVNGKPFMGPDVFFSPLRERFGQETSEPQGLAKRIHEALDNVIGIPRSTADLTRHGAVPNLQFYLNMATKADGRAEVWKHLNLDESFAKDVQRLVNPDKLELHRVDFSPLRSGIRAQAIDLLTGEVLQDLAKEEIINHYNPNSRFISDKMPGSPGFTASIGKGKWLTHSI
jgi:L-2-hydroxyglutarate oxidase LhgO